MAAPDEPPGRSRPRPGSRGWRRATPPAPASGAVTRRVEEAVYAHYGRPGHWRRDEGAGREDPELVAVRRRREASTTR
jgi:hypothetical protein